MKNKQLVVLVLCLGLVLSVFLSAGFAMQKDQKDKDKKEGKPEEKIFIPKEVKAVLEQGLASRQPRLDIPFTIFKQYYLPAQNAIHGIFFFKAKNVDLGFAPAPQSPAATAAKTEKEKEAQAAPEAQAQPAGIQAKFNVFLQFLLEENNAPPKIAREAFVPVALQADNASYDPEKEEWYTVGYTLLPGKYILAMAITSPDLKKIGTYYYEFSFPDAKAFTQSLETTPIFFVKQITKLEVPETRALVHQGVFTYSVLRMEPNLDNVFKAGDSLDIFFFIFGVKPVEAKPGEQPQQPQYNIEIRYEVKQGDKAAVRYEPALYSFPLISHALPMKQTVLIKTDKEEKREQRDLQAGKYTLSLKITDKVSGMTIDKTIDFEVK
jgi:hypothetical protein